MLFLTGYFSNLYSTRDDPNFLSILRVFVDSIEIGWKFLIKGIPNYGSSLSYIIGHWGEFFSSLSLSLFERRIEPGGKKLNGEIDALPLHPSSTSVAILFVGQLVYSEELESTAESN